MAEESAIPPEDLPPIVPVVRIENIPDDPRLSELQTHARALGLRLIVAIIGNEPLVHIYSTLKVAWESSS